MITKVVNLATLDELTYRGRRMKRIKNAIAKYLLRRSYSKFLKRQDNWESCWEIRLSDWLAKR